MPAVIGQQVPDTDAALNTLHVYMISPFKDVLQSDRPMRTSEC